MGILDRLNIRNSQVNEVTKDILGGGCSMFDFGISLGGSRYYDSYLWAVVQTIFNGLSNVEYTSDRVSIATEDIVSFMNANVKTAVWMMWNCGYISIENINGRYRFLSADKVRLDQYGEVINRNCTTIYSDKYVMQHKSDFQILAENLKNIDAYKNAEQYLVKNCGALGILSGNGMAVNEKDKEEMEEKFKKRYGITPDKWQFIFTPSNITFTPVNLPIKDLDLNGRTLDEVKLLCSYFAVPYDLIAMSGQSTYANQEQAQISFYRNCVMPLAEIGLSLSRQMLTDSKEMIPQSAISYKITNVAELEDDRRVEIETRTKYAQYLKELKELGVDITEKLKDLENGKIDIE